MATASMKGPVGARSSIFHLRPKQLSERPAMDQLPLLEVFKMGTPDAPSVGVGAEINYTKCHHTGPSFEAKISRSRLPTPVPHRSLFETIGTVFAEFPPRRRASGFAAAGSSRIDVLWPASNAFLGGAENAPVLCKARLGTGFSARTQKRPCAHGRLFLAGGCFEPGPNSLVFSRP
jgi:hypothetical protein